MSIINPKGQILADVKAFRLESSQMVSWAVVYPEKANKSSMWTHGVVIQSKTEENPTFKWLCLSSESCKINKHQINLGMSKSSSNVAKHLRSVHSYESIRSAKMSDTKKKKNQHVNEIKNSKMFLENEMMAHEYSYTMMAIEANLPHNFVSSEAFRKFASLSCKEAFNEKLHPGLVHVRITELYISLKEQIKGKITKDTSGAGIPIIHLLIDEWFATQLKQRFIAIRIRYVDEDFNLVTISLSVRHYDRQQVNPEMLTASETLLHWLRGVLSEFSISEDMIYSATTDAGPDVRCMICKLMGKPWEWCVAHLLTNALKESIGWLKSQIRKKEQTEIRNLVKKMNAMVARIRNSKIAMPMLEHIIIATLGKRLKLKPYLEIRFLGLVTAFERILRIWPCLVELYEIYYGESFPLLNDRNVIEQLYGLFRHLKIIQEHTQFRTHPVSCTTLLMLLEFEQGELQEGSDITINERKKIPSSNIEPLVEKVRTALRGAIHKRFYNRYRLETRADESKRGSGAPSSSFLLEMATVMHPAYKNLKCLDGVIAQHTGENPTQVISNQREVKKKIHDSVIALAHRVVQADEPNVRREIALSDGEEDVDLLADNISNNLEIEHSSASDNVFREYDQYMHEMGDGRRSHQKSILEWWKDRKTVYPIMSTVARCLLGSEASSGAVELDIGIAGMYLPNDRLSTSTQTVEMKLFVRRNAALLDYNNIMQINSLDIDKYLPQAPSIPFVEQVEIDESTLSDDDEHHFYL